MSGIIFILAICLGLTILLEALPILFVSNRKAWWKASVICNVVTNPILNVILFLLTLVLMELWMLMAVALVLEVAVVFLEAFFYQRMLNKTYLPCLIFSFFANLISFGLGYYFTVFLI